MEDVDKPVPPPEAGPSAEATAQPAAERKVVLPRKAQGAIRRAGGTIIRLAARRKGLSKSGKLTLAVATLLTLLVAGGGLAVLLMDMKPWERQTQPRRTLEEAGVAGIQNWLLAWSSEQEQKLAVAALRRSLESGSTVELSPGSIAVLAAIESSRTLVSENEFERAARIVVTLPVGEYQTVTIDPRWDNGSWRRLLAMSALILRAQDDGNVRAHFASKYGPFECDYFLGMRGRTANLADDAAEDLAALASEYLGLQSEFKRCYPYRR